MGLMDSLRHAEQRAANTARGGARRAKAGIEAAEASILRSIQSHRHAEESPERKQSASPKGRTAIVSINGEDVGKMHCTGK